MDGPGLTQEAEDYVNEKHVEGGAKVDNSKSTFKKGSDLDALADAAEDIPARGPNKYGNYEREVDAGPGNDVGNVSKDEGGASTTRYKVITDRWGTVLNLFPVK
ncbi:hypothetical protein ACFXO9_12550 [Nocardia tengchongensis]|uniref:hypothetical protein n=1 Tax=Nocardia tengchongensis TaxID=2055889 RepID=UPI0036935E7D